MDDRPGPASPPTPDVTVYWRPGCFFCRRLLRALEGEGVTFARRNIWEDAEARELVRSHNRGDETVPTVMVGSEVWTNPDARTVIAAVRASHPDAIDESPSLPGRRPRLFGRS